MVKKLLCLLAFVIALAQVGMAQAQDIVGTWQGTLTLPGHALRTVVKITKDGAAYKSVFYSIDQTGRPFPVESTTLTAGTLKMNVQSIGGTYEAKVSSDGNTMTGSFTQGANPLPLNLVKVSEAVSWTIPEAPKAIPMMAADAKPGFDVATIKPSKPDAEGKGFIVDGRTFKTINTSLVDMLTFAYSLQQKQIVGADAFGDQKYDLEGTPDVEGTPNSEQLRGMLQKLLADRFALKTHRDKKEMSAYVLTVAKTGNKMSKSDADGNSLPGLFFQGLGVLNVRNATMTDFAELMQSAVLDRPVVDQTGLAGRWNFLLKWTPDDSQFGGMGAKVPPPTDAANAPPALFTAMPEQLGLRLDATKTQVPVLVVDSVSKPSSN